MLVCLQLYKKFYILRYLPSTLSRSCVKFEMPEDREFDPSSGASEKPGMQPSLNRQFRTVNEK